MNQQYLVILAAAAMLLVVFVFAAIWAARFVKVGPDQVLVVFGRKVHRPDGSVVGYRIVNPLTSRPAFW